MHFVRYAESGAGGRGFCFPGTGENGGSILKFGALTIVHVPANGN